MKRKLIIGLALVILLVSGLPAFADMTKADKEEINKLYQQIAEIRKEIVRIYVGGGEITKEQGDKLIENIDKGEEYREENGGAFIPGTGCGGAGGGMMDGSNMMDGYNMMGGYYGNAEVEQI